MYIYIAIYLFNSILSFLEIVKKNKYLLLLSFFVISTFLNLAYTNGIDWTNYQYNYVYNVNSIRGTELGYSLLESVGRFFQLNFEMFKYFVLTIDLFLIYRYLYKESSFPLFSLVILFQTYLLGNFFEPAIRQIQAVVIFLVATKYLYNGKKIRFFISIMVAMLFHTSAIILFPLVYLTKRKISIKEFIFLIVLAIPSTEVLKKVIELIVNNIGIFSEYSFYFSRHFFEGTGYGLFNILKIIIYATPVIVLQNFEKENKKIIILHNLSILFILTFILQNNIFIFYRFNHYFIIPYVAYLAFVLKRYKFFSNKMVVFIIFVSLHLFSLVRGIEYYRDIDPMKYYPYTNYAAEVLKGTTFDSPLEKIIFRRNARYGR